MERFFFFLTFFLPDLPVHSSSLPEEVSESLLLFPDSALPLQEIEKTDQKAAFGEEELEIERTN